MEKRLDKGIKATIAGNTTNGNECPWIPKFLIS